jgi:hypothetical protein
MALSKNPNLSWRFASADHRDRALLFWAFFPGFTCAFLDKGRYNSMQIRYFLPLTFARFYAFPGCCAIASVAMEEAIASGFLFPFILERWN